MQVEEGGMNVSRQAERLEIRNSGLEKTFTFTFTFTMILQSYVQTERMDIY
jgi:hypothetical protein